MQFVGKEVEQRAGLYADPGSSVVFGAAVVRNHGTEPVELVEAHLVGNVRSAEAAVVEVRVLDLESGNRDLVGAAEWPFEDYAQRTQPLAGFTLDADAEAALLFVVDVHEEGSWVWPGTRLTYRVGGEELRADSSLGFHVCATTPMECASDRGL